MEYKDLSNYEPWDSLSLERRDFLKLFGGGVIVFFTVGDATILAARGGGITRPISTHI